MSNITVEPTIPNIYIGSDIPTSQVEKSEKQTSRRFAAFGAGEDGYCPICQLANIEVNVNIVCDVYENDILVEEGGGGTFVALQVYPTRGSLENAALSLESETWKNCVAIDDSISYIITSSTGDYGVGAGFGPDGLLDEIDKAKNIIDCNNLSIKYQDLYTIVWAGTNMAFHDDLVELVLPYNQKICQSYYYSVLET